MAHKKVMEALQHVNQQFPYVSQVFYGIDGKWFYCGDDFESPTFEHVDIGLLEDAAKEVEILPAAFSLY